MLALASAYQEENIMSHDSTTNPDDATNSPDDGGGSTHETGATMQPVPTYGLSPEAIQTFRSLLESPNVLEMISAFVRDGGVAGEERIVKLLYLVMTSRILERPVSLLIKGSSSGGKSFLLKSGLRLFPASAYWKRSTISPKALVRSKESFEHRMIVVEEAAGLNSGAELYLRLLISEGEISHETLGGGNDDWEGETFEKQGPVGVIITTTEINVHPENETRMLSVTVDESKAQLKKTILAAAKRRGVVGDVVPYQLFHGVVAQQSTAVVIPFLEVLAENVEAVSSRVRRDFEQVATLIEAHTLLHRAHRECDSQGRLVATLEDYTVVYDLVADIISYGVEIAVPEVIRDLVEAVDSLNGEYPDGVRGIAIAKKLNIDKSVVSRYVKTAIGSSYLINLEIHKGRPQRLILGDPLPIDVHVLPHPDVVAHGCMVARVLGVNVPTNELTLPSASEESDDDA